MARARNIKPGFFKNEDLAECSSWTRLCFAGLWTLADCEGRLEDRPKRIKGELFAFDSIEVDPLLVELQARGFIFRYQAAGQSLIQILQFRKHQNPHHREPKSVLPSPQSLGLLPDASTTEPWADDALHEDEAPGEAEAEDASDDMARGSSRADTGTLIPDTGEQHTSAGPTAKSELIPCPYDDIVALYHETLPMLPRVKLMSSGRQKALRKTWGWILSSKRMDGTRRATNAEEAIGWFKGYFQRAVANDFLMGRTARSPEHAGWKCDLDFLLTEKGMKQVIEKTQDAA